MNYKSYCINDICKVKSGKRIPIEMDYVLTETTHPYIRARDIKNGKIETENLIYLEDNVYEKIQKYIINSGDIAITIVGASVGDIAYANDTVDRYNLTENAVRLTEFSKNANGRYVFYLLFQKSYKDFMQLIAGASAQPKLGIYKIKRIKVSLPEREIQDKIVRVLKEYDSLIELNTKRIKALEQMAENLYKEWFVRFRFPGHEKAEFENGIPKGWNECRLEDILSFSRGVGYSSTEIIDGDIALLSMNNIRPYGGYIADYSRVYSGKYKNHQVVCENDLIMSITDMTQDRRIIGYVGIVSPTEKKCVICTHLMKVSSHIYHNYFLYGMFTFSGLSRYISEYATGANVLGLTANILNRIKCKVPNKELADKYTQLVTPLIKEMHSLEIQNNNLIKQRDLLLPRLMSGKLEV